MPVDAFALVRGATQPVSSKQEAEKVWEPKFIGEIVSGRDPRKPPARPAAEGMTVADFLDQYYERYVVAESLRSIVSIRSRLAALKEGLGTLPVSALERIDTIEDFKRDYAALPDPDEAYELRCSERSVSDYAVSALSVADEVGLFDALAHAPATAAQLAAAD
jgi:hypothetical protein